VADLASTSADEVVEAAVGLAVGQEGWAPPGSRCRPRAALTRPRPASPTSSLTTLPTNPAQLRAWIYTHKDGGQSADNQAWTDISDLLEPR